MSKLKVRSGGLVAGLSLLLMVGPVQAQDAFMRGPMPFGHMDADKDGVVSQEEFDQAHANRMGGMGRMRGGAQPMFERFDSDGDGQLSAEELAAGRQQQWGARGMGSAGGQPMMGWGGGPGMMGYPMMHQGGYGMMGHPMMDRSMMGWGGGPGMMGYPMMHQGGYGMMGHPMMGWGGGPGMMGHSMMGWGGHGKMMEFMWQQMDTDGNGELSQEEFRSFHQPRGGFCDFDQLDQDGNEMLDRKEYNRSKGAGPGCN